MRASISLNLNHMKPWRLKIQWCNDGWLLWIEFASSNQIMSNLWYSLTIDCKDTFGKDTRTPFPSRNNNWMFDLILYVFHTNFLCPIATLDSYSSFKNKMNKKLHNSKMTYLIFQNYVTSVFSASAVHHLSSLA